MTKKLRHTQDVHQFMQDQHAALRLTQSMIAHIDMTGGDHIAALLLHLILTRTQQTPRPPQHTAADGTVYQQLTWDTVWETTRIKEWSQGSNAMRKLKAMGLVKTMRVQKGMRGTLYVSLQQQNYWDAWNRVVRVPQAGAGV